MDRTLHVIRSLHADVVAIQEATIVSTGLPPIHLRQLEDATGMKAVPGMTLWRKDAHYGNVLLAAHPVRHVHRIDLSMKGREPRGAIMVAMDVDHRLIRIAATHLGLKRDERRHQVKHIIRAMGRDHDLAVLMGDLNEWEPFGMMARLLRIHFGRSWSPPSYPSCFPVLALDRILVRPAGARKTVETVRTPSARSASDHLPVAAIIDPAAS